MSRAAMNSYHDPAAAGFDDSFKLELLGATTSTAANAPPAAHRSLPDSPVSCSAEDVLPTSVRGAAPELRKMIRKRQNSESAKRCRERKKIENARTADEIMHQASKVRRLEAVVEHLARRLQETHAMLNALTGSPGYPAPPTALCPTGHPQCRGAECAMCVRAIQSTSPPPPPPPPPPQSAHPAPQTVTVQPQMVQSVDAHTEQLQRVLDGGGSWE